MDKKLWIKIGLYSAGALALTGVTVLTVKTIQKKRFSSQNKGVGADRDSEKLIGKTVEIGSDTFVNVRSTPEIPNNITNCAWYDALCWGQSAANYVTSGSDENVVFKATSNPVGVIKSVVKGKDGWNWYKITYKGIDYGSAIDSATNWGSSSGNINVDKTGYVREDVVNIKN